VDNRILITSSLKERLDLEAAADGELYPGVIPSFYAFMKLENGQVLPFSGGDRTNEPSEMQKVFGTVMCEALNSDLHHDGAWVVAFTHPPSVLLLGTGYDNWQRMVRIFIDKDGDAQFSIETTGDFRSICTTPVEDWVQGAELCWKKWRHLMVDVLDPSEGQTYKRSQGQQANPHRR
jgi:hypothetical protein